MLPEFLSLRPETAEEAAALLADLRDVKVLAGGTDLLVRMRKGEAWQHVVDVSGIESLTGITREGDVLLIGAASTHRAIHTDAAVKGYAGSLSLACGLIGSPQIRNMGTLGGNLVNASPAADSIPPLLIHDASMVLKSKAETRKVGLEAFVVEPYRTLIRGDELLTGVEVALCEGYREGYRRVAKRAAWAISRLSIAWAVKEERGRYGDVRLAIGSCTPMPFRPREAERLLAGQDKRPGLIREAVALVIDGIRRTSGERPSFAYKIPVLEGLLEDILRG